MISSFHTYDYTISPSALQFPRGMIKSFATIDAEAVRGMFVNLYDESKNLAERIEQFQISAEELRVKHDDGTWRQHYQGENAITTYLWLRYPDKYYIYKYSEVRSFAKALDPALLFHVPHCRALIPLQH